MNFVIIDDHPLILEGYKMSFHNYLQSKFVTLCNCEEV